MARFQTGDTETARRGGLALQAQHAEAQRLAKRAADLEAALSTIYVMTTDPHMTLGRIGAFALAMLSEPPKAGE